MEERRVLCADHAERLHRLEVAVTGNGGGYEEKKNSLQWKVDLIIERQKPLFDFIEGWKKVFWICLPICVTGAIAALWNFGVNSIKHGLL